MSLRRSVETDLGVTQRSWDLYVGAVTGHMTNDLRGLDRPRWAVPPIVPESLLPTEDKSIPVVHNKHDKGIVLG